MRYLGRTAMKIFVPAVIGLYSVFGGCASNAVSKKEKCPSWFQQQEYSEIVGLNEMVSGQKIKDLTLEGILDTIKGLCKKIADEDELVTYEECKKEMDKELINNPEEMAELRKEFSKMDCDGDGKLGPEDGYKLE